MIELRFIDHRDPLCAGERELRHQVLARPLGIADDAVHFDFEDRSVHLVALDVGRVVGCVLFHPEPPSRAGRLYQMAVATEAQGKGLGRRLVGTLHDHLRASAIERVYLNARKPVVGFYEALGYRPEGDPFIEIGIEHRRMATAL